MPRVVQLAVIALAGCAESLPSGGDPGAPFFPVYDPAEILVLDDDLIAVGATMGGARSEADLRDFADCVIAGYALNNGYEFARHLSTNVTGRAGVWRADAVYTISPERPAGDFVIDAADWADKCKRDGIPTV